MSRTSRQYVDAIGQGLVNAALRLDAARRAQLAAPRDGASALRPRVPGEVPRAFVAPARRPQFTCTPRAGMPACNAFDLTTASVVQVPAGTVVPAWPGPGPGVFAGGATMQVRLPNGHFAIAYTRDFTRVIQDRVGRDQVGQIGQTSLVDAALRLEAARRASLAERVRRQQGLPGGAQPLPTPTKGPGDLLTRLPGDDVVRLPDLGPARRRVPGEGGTLDIPDPNRPRIPPRAELLRRFGIVEGPAVIERDRGAQIWSAPAGEYRPGTNIPAMTRLWVLPRGTPVFLTPNEALITALENAALFNSSGQGIATDGSYFVRWDVSRSPISTVFQAVGIPTQGEGWARPYAPDGGAWFRSVPVPT